MSDDTEPHRIECPKCNWQSRKYELPSDELASKVDAEIHYTNTHGGRIPPEAPFGNNQCPECLDINGFNGTVSCSECGYVPEKVRA